jgi:hypothetical protein
MKEFTGRREGGMMVMRMTGTMRLRSEKPKLKKSPATRGKMQAISDVHIV